jgi:hypothetical protein
LIWFGKPVPQNRMLGQVDSDDPTNLPAGLASLAKNFEWTRDTAGPTCANSRCGCNTAMQCLDHAAPVTGLLGFVYSPESASDPFFQLPLAFQPTEGSQYESPVGTGRMVAFPPTNFQEPSLASLGVPPHVISASAGNRVFQAYSDLSIPAGGLANLDPKAKTMNPYGMKPVGFYWVPNTPVLQGEICCPPTPTTGNGHTYQAQNSGTTGANAPIFPTGESATVNDNGIIWKENTMVIANRLPPPDEAQFIVINSGGTIPANIRVYAVITFLNSIGETLPSLPHFIATVVNNSQVKIEVPSLAQLPAWIRNLPSQYVPTQANVYAQETGIASPAPALSTYYQLGGSVALGSTVNFVPGSGTAPPVSNTARITPGQLPTPTVEPEMQVSPAGSVVTPPSLPTISLAPSAGSAFTAGQVIDVALTLVNANGETTRGPAPPIKIINNGDGILVSLAASYGPTVTGVNIYLSTNGFSAGTGSLESGSPFAVGSVTTLLAFGPSTTLPTTNTATLPLGTFPAGRDVYVAQTYTNASGETPLGPANFILNTAADDSILVTVAVPLGPDNEQLYTITSVGIYEADVATGTAAPAPSAFALVGYYQPGNQPFILNTATGPNPPITNTTGPGGAIVADTATGGANGGQGYRYAAFGWINQMETFSGFTLASVVKTIIDEDGWEIGAFNVPTGMPNVVGRYVPFSGADGSQAGPFNWIGLVNLIVPSQNVVFPMQTLIDTVLQSATVFLDNVTTQGTFNFTDTYLQSANNVDDRLQLAIPPQGVRVDYLESVDRLAITGVPGFASGPWISLAEDYESFYGALSPVPVTTTGERCFGVTDKYKGIVFALMEESGFVLNANTGAPASWAATRRWQGMGPCGFRAWDANGKFIIFAHRSGLYKYDESDPDMMQKEIPKLWSTINWAAGETICVYIDEDTHTVHCLAPTGASTVPNQDFVLSYIEGWNNPIHFSTFSGKEISMDAARRWSPHDRAAFVVLRMKRTLPPGGNQFIDGPTFETLPDSSFLLTQLLFASSANDGTVQARTPGIFSDNGGYIDWQYETMSSGMMQAVCKPEGFNLNATGSGVMIASFIASREQVTDEGGEQKLIIEEEEVEVDPIPLSPKQVSGITRKCNQSAVNEFWRMRFRGDRQPGTWVSLKIVTPYVIPVTPGRDAGDR